MHNPVFTVVQGQPVYHVRKDDENPLSRLQTYWFSLEPDNTNRVDVRRLPGYVQPLYDSSLPGTALECSERWEASLWAEAERVIALALATGHFVSQPSA